MNVKVFDIITKLEKFPKDLVSISIQQKNEI